MLHTFLLVVASLKCTGEPISLLGPDWFTKARITAKGPEFDSRLK